MKNALQDVFRTAEKILLAEKIENAPQEARWIVSDLAGVSSAELPVSGRELSGDETERILSAIRRRAAGEPLQYILGNEFFGDNEFKVAPGVLIPRPETWKIVEIFAEKLPHGASVCELGTGSGAVSVSLALKRPDLRVYASDISREALAIASENVRHHGVRNVLLKEGSLFSPFPDRVFDAVAANLPYIPVSEKNHLPREVRDHEPPVALFADDSGMAVMKKAVLQMSTRLIPKGVAMFEMAPEQTIPMTRFFQENGFENVTRIFDLYGVGRFLFAVRNLEN